MEMDLTLQQARVIGCLLEKEVTTPDQYPLSLNGLTVACNQKSNREPVMSLSDAEVQNLLDELAEKRLIREESGFGSRVVKYKHRFCNTEFSDLQLSAQELGIVCVMLLRGPQTPGELRTRTNRLCEFDNVKQVETVLEKLSDHAAGTLVVQLPREPGKRESRYMHCFSGEVEAAVAETVSTASASAVTQQDSGLEARVAQLEAEVAELKALLEELTS